jgi:hypothetical protein
VGKIPWVFVGLQMSYLLQGLTRVLIRIYLKLLGQIRGTHLSLAPSTGGQCGMSSPTGGVEERRENSATHHSNSKGVVTTAMGEQWGWEPGAQAVLSDLTL